jgi:peptide/nickel transport system ATP-binding protein
VTTADANTPDVLACEGLSVDYRTGGGSRHALIDLTFRIAKGEAYGLVGESGCGKSTVALAIMRYLSDNAVVSAGRLLFEGVDLARVDAASLKGLRGRRIAMVYQDPMSSLNPVMRIGPQLVDVVRVHGLADRAGAKRRALEVLREVELPDPESIVGRYPHQLSGGQQQRVVIAMALMANPRLLIMDEPTTGLDVTVEAAVLDLVDGLRRRYGAAVLFISHNLGAVRRLCDRIGVLYAGRLVEEGTIAVVYRRPLHPYTRGLLGCVPAIGADRHQRPLAPIPRALTDWARSSPGCVFAERCAFVEGGRCTQSPIPLIGVDGARAVRCVRWDELPAPDPAAASGTTILTREPTPAALDVRGLTKTYAISSGLLGGRGRVVRALAEVDIAVSAGRTLAIVGESGSGKSTLARVLIGLTTADAGEARLGAFDIAALPIEKRSRELRQRLQMVFQNPDSTLNPSHSVGFALARTLRRLRGLDRRAARAEARRLLETVQLPAAYAERRPQQLSGGEKQRVAIARALAAAPDIILADEPVSALDVSVQAAVVNLLNDLQDRLKVAMVFISHDLALVRYMADDVALLYGGRVVEVGPVEAVFAPPYHPYTQMLLAAAPNIDPDAPRRAAVIGEPTRDRAVMMGRGCPFAGRCPYVIENVCESVPPPVHEPSPCHRIACHLPGDGLPKGLTVEADASFVGMAREALPAFN